MDYPLCFAPAQLAPEDAVLVLVSGQPLAAVREALLDCAAARGFRLRSRVALSDPDALPCSEAMALAPTAAGDTAARLDGLLPPCQALADHHAVDISLRTAVAFQRPPRLAVFDMDSTLIQAEVIDELARAAGCWQQVSAITERAMRGELDFASSFRERMATLRGLDADAVAAVAARIELSPGAGVLLATLRALGVYTAIVSGGFDVFARRVQALLGMDAVHANALAMHDGRLSGEAQGRIVDAQRKRELLTELQHRRGLDSGQVLAVGDGANDLPMLAAAGMGVAYRAKPAVRAAARHRINHGGLDSLLFMLGIARHHWREPSPVAAAARSDIGPD